MWYSLSKPFRDGPMDKQEFSAFRQKLQKTQKQISELLGISLKAVQSFEQGWRKVPAHIERHILFLEGIKGAKTKGRRPCWQVQKCSTKTRRSCPAWELEAGYLCWFINGTLCAGMSQGSWEEKMKICRKCKVFAMNLGLSQRKDASHTLRNSPSYASIWSTF